MYLYSDVLKIGKRGFKKTPQPSFQLVAPIELWIKHKAGVTDLQRSQLLNHQILPFRQRQHLPALSFYPYAYPLILRRKMLFCHRWKISEKDQFWPELCVSSMWHHGAHCREGRSSETWSVFVRGLEQKGEVGCSESATDLWLLK